MNISWWLPRLHVGFTVICLGLFVVFVILWSEERSSCDKKGRRHAFVDADEYRTLARQGGVLRALWVQPVFIPTEVHLEACTKVLRSLEEYQANFDPSNNSGDHTVTIYVVAAGFALQDHWWEEYVRVWKDIQSRLSERSCVQLLDVPVRYEHNYGQAYVYRETLRSLGDPERYPYTFINGSDLYLTSPSPPVLHDILMAFEGVRNLDYKVAHMAFNMTPFNVHTAPRGGKTLTLRLPGSAHRDIRDARTVVLYFARKGVAGSTAVFHTEELIRCGGYRVGGVFCSDDGEIKAKIRGLGFDSVIVENLYVVHEKGASYDDPRFLSWKLRSLQYSATHNKDLTAEELLPWALESEDIFRGWSSV